MALGIAEGQTAVALGMAAAPIVSLKRGSVALGGWAAPGGGARPGGPFEPSAREPEFTLAHGSGFASAVLLIMLCEQTFLNAGPLLVEATEGAQGAALAGFTFNVLLIARAPLQLFQPCRRRSSPT